MSIIRDLLEYYRLPSIVGTHQDDFEVQNNILSGYEVRWYYNKDLDYDGSSLPGEPYRMVVDQYTTDDILYRRTYFYYDDDFNVTSIESQYDSGLKQKTETYTYGTTGEIEGVESIETDIYVVWPNMEPSTGWPERFNKGGLNWVHVNATTQGEEFTGYLCDTSGGEFIIYLPTSPALGTILGFEDVQGTFSDTKRVVVNRNGGTIMGIDENLILNEVNQGLQLVYDGLGDWRIVWTTPLVSNITTT